MCDPMTAMTAMKVVGGVASFNAQNDAADAQNARYAENRVNAINARDLKVRQLAVRNAQEAAKSAQEQRLLAIEAMKQQATAMVSAGESGIGGNSVSALLRSYEADALRGVTVLQTDYEATYNQLQMERQGLDSEMMNRIGSIQQASKPDPFAAAIGIAADAFAINTQFGGDLVDTAVAKAGAASGLTYGTNFMSEQSLMLAAQEF